MIIKRINRKNSPYWWKKKDHGHSAVSCLSLPRFSLVSIALPSSFAIVFCFVSSLNSLLGGR
jgi:hypothetical protein